MVAIPPELRAQLKKPLGRLQTDYGKLKAISKTHRIIAVGDVCTLGLLSAGIKPHLAVFDHLFMRHDIDQGMKERLEGAFTNPLRYKNPPGTLSDEIIADAGMLLEKGGAVLIDGEEDLTALAFIRSAGKGDIIIYGQPNEGFVVVRPSGVMKKKIEGWLSAAALGHEVERDVSE
jgi:GTP-dependent dephospho-CoA kinase